MVSGFARFGTAIGECAVAWTERGVCAVMLPSADDVGADMQRRFPDTPEAAPPPQIKATIDRMVGVLAGASDDLRDVTVDLADASEFAQRVWAATREITPGKTTTYGEIAQRLGQPHAAREVGQALGRNPVPIVVPCHRVLGAGGRMVGFSAPGGVTTKLRMLQIEGAAFEGQPALF
jgi:methylated-DNA-[protein]-cysteine S-methyltransferase